MLNILRDIRGEALPMAEIPSFLFWLVGKSFWFWFALIMAGLIYLMVK
jgi:hypothetical protein